MVVRLVPQPSLFDESVQLVRESTPVTRSAFYLRRPFFVPWSAEPTVFVLTTDEPDQPHEFTINRSETFSIVPGQTQYTLTIQLVKGANRIAVSTPSQDDFFITVAATAVESWFNVLGREYYLSVGRRLEDITNHYNTPWTTRVSAHLLSFADLFLPARMPKVQQTRFAVMTAVGQRLGHGDGVIRMAQALSYTTPPVTKPFDAEFTMPGADPDYPYVTTHPTTGEAKGRVLDLWTPNNCLAAHQALFQMTLAMGGEDVPEPKPLSLVGKDDRQILLKFAGGPTEVHFLDPLAPECDDIEFNTACDSGVRTFAQVDTIIDIMMTAPQLPFDVVVEQPILFGFYDEGNWFDASTGHPDPGLGGGDDAHDTVDPDDPYGDGFFGFSLSRRFDAPACLDTRVQVGQRLAKYTAPITSTSPPALTPEPPLVEGIAISIDAEAGAPSPSAGNTVFWASSKKTYVYEGDYIRFENPDLETQIVSAWPVFDATKIIKSDATATYTPSGTQKIITAPTGFFEQRHEGKGIRVDGSDLFCIVSTSDDGISSYATISGNPAIPAAGPFIVNVYEPLRDRLDTSEPAAFSADDIAGSVTYEFTVADPLVDNHSSGDIGSYRVAPRASGAVSAGDIFLSVMSDMKPLPGDLLYFTSGLAIPVLSAMANGAHHTTGFPIYDIELDAGTAATGTLEANAGGSTIDGENFVLDDGVNPAVTFEFDDDASVVESATLRAVTFTGSETTSEMRDLIITAITNAPALEITAAIGGSAIVSLTSNFRSTVGNVAITQSGTSLASLSGMAGGVDAPTPALVDNEALFSWRADPCWQNGDPVTPLVLLSMAPTAYLTY